MFITLGYIFIWLYQSWYEKTQKMKYFSLVQRCASAKESLVFRNLQKVVPSLSESCHFSPLVEHALRGWTEEMLIEDHAKQVVRIHPKQKVDLQRWTSFLKSQSWTPEMTANSGKLYILLETVHPDDENAYMVSAGNIPKRKRVKVDDYGIPLAWRSGSPFGVVVLCSPDQFATLGKAFVEGCLFMEDVLEIQEMLSVEVVSQPAHLLRFDSSTDYIISSGSDTPCKTNSGFPFPSREGSLRKSSLHKVEERTEVPFVVDDDEGEGSKVEDKEDEEELFAVNEVKEMITQNNLDKCQNEDEVEDEEEEEEEEISLRDMVSEVLITDDSGPQKTANHTQKSKGRTANLVVKPPNVLIYCGKKDSARLFLKAKAVFEQCLSTDSYAIYHLKHDQVHSTPWIENTALLIICSDKLYDATDSEFLEYFQKGGNILSFGSPLDGFFIEKEEVETAPAAIMSLTYKSWKEVTTICTRFAFRPETVKPSVEMRTVGFNQKTKKPAIVIVKSRTGGTAILSQVLLEKDPSEMAINADIFSLLKQANHVRFEILRDMMSSLGFRCEAVKASALTPAVLLCCGEGTRNAFLSSIQHRLKNGLLKSQKITLNFLDSKRDLPETITPDILPILTRAVDSRVANFDFAAYKDNLGTRVLGQGVLYSDVMQSTMPVLDGLLFSVPEDIGLIAIAGQQTSGKGRGENTWLSPRGCALFTLHLRIPLKSKLGQRLAFIQHITSAAVVEAVTSMPGYQDICLRLKWPNDIYYNNVIKLGGVIVNSTIMHGVVHAVIGCGFNVSNSNPTICINDIIKQYNQENGTSLPLCSTEQLIALAVTALERLVDLFQTEGVDAFLKIYYKYWLHSGAQIQLEREGNLEVEVTGLDEHGYLLVQAASGRCLSVQPDSNSFDMMKNLIKFKER
ncbi:biotin--protein ligase [Lingula anatina]|uniref:Biotin--protein ligase n=1 Tax=Lingula anatina TaxID=7574 RepID=A0A1S3JV07_LINAN|nr:biotin--protein ligase [Lingula anatina]XP_013414152.1 biotin--protein ligase [Lingula anatina]XP_013414153.1 biotin--protein ligase [Lingula anatina]XP_013414154.1 biotin--protein ligase [Lingula anatina]|eukprot:XP_013414151.1 biotin--protein ligase [Lingula anatina]